MRCAVTFAKIVQHGNKHLNIYNEVTNYPDYTFSASTTRLAASAILLAAGTYTLSAEAEGVTCKVYTYADEQAAGVFPAAGEGELPFTFTLPEARRVSVNFAYEGWGDAEITPDAVTNAVICEGTTPTDTDVWETVALHPHELADSDTIAQAVNSKMSVPLKIFPGFEAWQFCEKTTTYVQIIDLDRDSDRCIFRGRVSAITDSMDDSGLMYQDVTCVSALDFLEDTSVFDSNYHGYLQNLIPAMVSVHNTAVGGDDLRKFSYSVTGNAYYSKGGTVYGSCYSVLSAMLTGGEMRKYSGDYLSPGAYTMEFRESFAGGVNTLEIAESFGQTVDTAILIGDNLRSIRVEKALQDVIYTQVCAVSGVNSDGVRRCTWATNDEMYARYGGGHVLTVSNDSIKCTAAVREETQYSAAYYAMLAALKEFAEEEAAKLSAVPLKLTISAADLAEMGYAGYERFEVGSSYPVICPPLGLNGKPMRITALKRRLCDGRIEQITIETGTHVNNSPSSLSAMLARLDELNRQISDSVEEQVEIAQTIAEEVVDEQTDGVKIRLQHPQGYGEVPHLNIVIDGDGRTDLYADDYLIGGSGGYAIVGLTKSQYDALETYSSTTIYIVNNSGTIEMYVGTQRITSQGGGGATIETAAVLTSEQMTEWAPEHELLPVEFRGSAAVYYAQAPSRLVIQGQRALFNVAENQMTAADIMSELTYEFRDGTRQKFKAYITVMNPTSVKLEAALFDISGASESRIGYGASSSGGWYQLPSGWSSLKIGFAVHVSSYYLNDIEELAPHYAVKMYVFADGVMCGSGQLVPGITGMKFDFSGVTPVTDFGSAAERGFASGISRRTEPSYSANNNNEEEGGDE